MAEEEELAQSTVGEFVTVSHLLATSEALQIALIIMAAGIIGTVIAYRKFSSWVGAQRFYYQRPHISRFLRRAVLPVFVIILITVINVHVQTGILEREEEDRGSQAPARHRKRRLLPVRSLQRSSTRSTYWWWAIR